MAWVEESGKGEHFSHFTRSHQGDSETRLQSVTFVLKKKVLEAHAIMLCKPKVWVFTPGISS